MIYAIADLHLSFANHKPMDVFGPVWRDHTIQIKNNWDKVISDDDLVIIPGDTSWAMRAEYARVDLEWVGNLSGTKLLIKGNHDYWWSTMSRARSLMPARCHALLGGIFLWDETIIVGTRGWLCPGDPYFNKGKKNHYIYNQECRRLDRLLKSVAKFNNKKLIVAMHYPPFNPLKESSGFTRLMTFYQVDLCVYGHLHDTALKYVYDGILDNVEYRCVSADRLMFKPEPCLLSSEPNDLGDLLQHTFSI